MAAATRTTDDSDWDHVTILRKSRPTGAAARSVTAVNAALRKGEEVIVTPKTKTSATAYLLDQETDASRHTPVGMRRQLACQAARTQLQLTREQLAQKCNVPKSLVDAIETGKAIMNDETRAALRALERHLKVKLTGPDSSEIGKPLSC